MTTLFSHRDKGYKQALNLAQRTLKLHHPFTLDDCMETAMKAMNECGHWVKKGRIRLVYEGPMPVIQIIVGYTAYEPKHIQRLLTFAKEHSVLHFLCQGSGIGQVINLDENPF